MTDTQGRCSMRSAPGAAPSPGATGRPRLTFLISERRRIIAKSAGVDGQPVGPFIDAAAQPVQ
ncbi:MAG: hypothetical protein ACK5SI_00090, partial [Planctomycetia bacterium]